MDGCATFSWRKALKNEISIDVFKYENLRKTGNNKARKKILINVNFIKEKKTDFSFFSENLFCALPGVNIKRKENCLSEFPVAFGVMISWRYWKNCL